VPGTSTIASADCFRPGRQTDPRIARNFDDDDDDDDDITAVLALNCRRAALLVRIDAFDVFPSC